MSGFFRQIPKVLWFKISSGIRISDPKMVGLIVNVLMFFCWGGVSWLSCFFFSMWFAVEQVRKMFGCLFYYSFLNFYQHTKHTIGIQIDSSRDSFTCKPRRMSIVDNDTKLAKHPIVPFQFLRWPGFFGGENRGPNFKRLCSQPPTPRKNQLVSP